MPNPAIRKKSEVLRNNKPGLKKRPDIIPRQTGKPIRRKGISLFSTVRSYETIMNKDMKKVWSELEFGVLKVFFEVRRPKTDDGSMEFPL
jgi:hypothetical protein